LRPRERFTTDSQGTVTNTDSRGRTIRRETGAELIKEGGAGE